MRLGRETPLPQRLFTTLDLERAQQVCARLEQLGAQVGMLQVGAPPVVVRPPADGRERRRRVASVDPRPGVAAGGRGRICFP